eukprot:TRINITY_DN11197_c0_g2_i1.p1 TRINITY_DN11197_c0_g2~~TRINITY_DN11197_c0_g2_i1.p1  ORF type:complete len:102 (+),score=10.45 TRINITY_DN11197_c0_g2_i1:758-1063(+)
MHKKTFFQAAMSSLVRGKLDFSETRSKHRYNTSEHQVDYNELAEKTLKECGIIRKRHHRAGPTLRKGSGQVLLDSRASIKHTLSNVYSSLSKNNAVNRCEQ